MESNRRMSVNISTVVKKGVCSHLSSHFLTTGSGQCLQQVKWGVVKFLYIKETHGIINKNYIYLSWIEIPSPSPMGSPHKNNELRA